MGGTLDSHRPHPVTLGTLPFTIPVHILHTVAGHIFVSGLIRLMGDPVHLPQRGRLWPILDCRGLLTGSP